MPRLLAEDEPFLTGAARFVADVAVADVLHAGFVRSTVAHGNLTAVKTDAARAGPGVVAVFDAADLGLAPFAYFPSLPAATARPPLATDRVRFVGEPVALVVAISEAALADAAELVEVEIEPLPALVDLDAALSGAALHDDLGTNVVRTVTATSDIDPLAGAAVVVTRRVHSPRLSPLPLEAAGIVVIPTREQAGDGLEVWAACQGVHAVRDDLAAILGMDPAHIRVRSTAVGGGFGARYRPPIEYLVVAAAARHLQRPLRWTQSRSEQLSSDLAGRAQRNDIELGVSADGLFTGVKVRGVADAGAYPNQAPLLVDYTCLLAAGPYRMAAAAFSSDAVMTTTPPVGAYRGAGQPEMALALETAIDTAARRLDLDPAELRRRNLLAPEDLPASNASGLAIDRGDLPAALDLALALVDAPGVRARQRRQPPSATTRVGLGLAAYVQISAGGRLSMRGQVAIGHDGSVTAASGGHSHGQGHHSTMARLVARQLQVDTTAVNWRDDDTAVVARGVGTGGSRTAALAGRAVTEVCEALVEVARPLAAALLEADPADIVVGPGGLAVAGVPASTIPWATLARHAGPDALRAEIDTAPGPPNTPYGVHATVVEVDVETGGVRVVAHAAVDDCGVRLAPELVEGQQHGGAVAGLSQGLGEMLCYDDDGTPRTTSLADYLVPSAAEVPYLHVGAPETAATTNTLGVRGIGENGAIVATPALLNAVADALGSDEVDLPITPEAVWRWWALRNAGTTPAR